MFAIGAEADIDFLRRIIYVLRQVKIIRGKQVFARSRMIRFMTCPSLNCCARFRLGTCRCFPR